jgi:class 3 adenylate cyclase
MKWWARSRLRTKIFLAFSILILVLLLLTLWLTQLMVSRQVQGTLRAELLTTGQVFQGLIAERAERLLTNGTLLVSDFAFKRVMALSRDPEEYDPSTLTEAARNYQQRIGADLLWVINDVGILLADSRDKLKNDPDLSAFPPVAETLISGEGSWGVTEVDGALFQIVVIPVTAAGGKDIIGFVALGREIDDLLAQQLEKDTGSHISFLTQGRLFASSWSPDERAKLLFPKYSLVDLLRHPVEETFLLLMNGERFLSILIPIDAQLPYPLYALMQRSYDEALIPLYTLRQRIVWTGVGALVVALFTGIGLAGGITAPIQTLVVGMQDVLRGQLNKRLTVTREDEIGFLAQSFNEMVEGLEERERIRDTFGRFVSRDVAEVVLSERAPLTGERREVSILFQDIRGFTTLSERTDPEEIVCILNQFFTEMVAAVEAEGGIVKQFTGDGVMALFGAPVSHPDDPERAVRAALGMVSRLERLNVRLRSQNTPALRIGVGIHTGEVVAGQIGPDERIEYAVVGDPVNVASRIEGLTKEVGATILVSEATATRLGQDFVLGRRAALPVKGKEKPVRVIEVLSYEPRSNAPAQGQLDKEVKRVGVQ